jgi:glycosyltransferase involved in cell wall biosynthesis
VMLSGVVFTTVLNPRDGRKNWSDILTAFCHALGDREDATLVFKMTHHSVASFLGDLLMKLGEVGPIRARVLAVHGFLTDQEYHRLIAASSWYVNASRGEGLCLPLMEFMSAGVPGIAPAHTAMADYVDERSTLVVGASRVPTRWPNDPRHRVRTRYYRIDWESLAGRYREAYAIATNDPGRYATMSQAAAAAIRGYAGRERVAALLEDHLEHPG